MKLDVAGKVYVPLAMLMDTLRRLEFFKTDKSHSSKFGFTEVLQEKLNDLCWYVRIFVSSVLSVHTNILEKNFVQTRKSKIFRNIINLK